MIIFITKQTSANFQMILLYRIAISFGKAVISSCKLSMLPINFSRKIDENSEKIELSQDSVAHLKYALPLNTEFCN